MLEKAKAGSGVLFSEGNAFVFERGASFVEAAKLLFVKIGILGEGHHRSLDLDGLAAGEIANERCDVLIGHADTANAGVNTDVEWDGLLRFGGNLIQCGAQRRVNHRHDAAGDGVFDIAIVERTAKENALEDAGAAA